MKDFRKLVLFICSIAGFLFFLSREPVESLVGNFYDETKTVKGTFKVTVADNGTIDGTAYRPNYARSSVSGKIEFGGKVTLHLNFPDLKNGEGQIEGFPPTCRVNFDDEKQLTLVVESGHELLVPFLELSAEK